VGERRVTSIGRHVGLDDVGPDARARLDALARIVQDVSDFDASSAPIDGMGLWILRRMAIDIAFTPRFRAEVTARTWCSGVGARWAERTTHLYVGDRLCAEAVAIWVYVDRAGRPARLGEWFFEHYGGAAGGRKVSSRLSLPHPPAGAHVRPWPVRASDFDLLRHVNNAAYWYAVEDELARLAPGRAPVSAELEHRAAIEPGDPVELRSTVDDDDVLWVWLTARGETRSAAQVRLGAPGKRHAPR